MNNVLSLPIKKVSQKIVNAEIRPSELCNAALKLTTAIKPLNAFINVTSESAKKLSQDADDRVSGKESLGVLDGIPIAIKDNFCTAGYTTTCGSFMLANFIPGYDATVYKRLKESGAVLIGKTNLDQFAMGSGTVDSYFGPTKNLYGSEVMKNYICGNNTNAPNEDSKDNWHIAGGSSGGSAVAVATNAVFAAIGSDTGGSTRNPASYCGLVGLKPTYGLVSRHGLIPLVNSMDVPGILTRTVEDSAIILNAIAGPDNLDSTTFKRPYKPIELPSSIDVSRLKIGIPKEYGCPELSQEVEEAWMNVAKLLEEAGARILPVTLPHTEHSIVCYSVLNRCEVASNMARYDGLEFGYRANEMSSTKELAAKSRAKGFNDVIRSRILAGNYFLLQHNYEDYFVKAMKVRRVIADDFNTVWNSGVDLLLTPTTLSDAPNYKDFVSQDNQTQCSVQDFCTQPANMAGIPAISLPVKLSRKGLPLSLQLMAPRLHEQKLLSVAKWIEDAVQFPMPVLKDESLLK